MLATFKVALIGAAVAALIAGVQEFRVQGLKSDLSAKQSELDKQARDYAEERTRLTTNLLTAQEAARSAEQALQDYVNTEGRKKDEQVKAANAVAADMSKRLRLATEEARKLAAQIREGSKTAGTEGTVPRSDDTLVPATIGQEDVDEAIRADDIRLSLLECYNVYRKARKTIDDYNAKLDSAPVREASQTGEDAP